MVIILMCYLLFTSYYLLASDFDIRESLIRSYLILIGFTAILTEILSLFDLIIYQVIMIAWFMIFGGMLFIVIGQIKNQIHRVVDNANRIKTIHIRDISFLEKTILFSIVFILALTLIVALSAPPNNFDSMTYHMARVANWIQHQNINYYPTAIPRQNYSMPLAEYLILNVQIISQSDIFANLIQWSGFVMAIVLVSKIAQYLHISRRGQFISSLFTATLPVAILQSSSTQNDLITGVLCLSFAYYLLKTIRERHWTDVFFASMSLGLALMVKGTAYIYCAVIGLVIGISGLLAGRRKEILDLSKKFTLIILFALLLNCGVYIRNLNLYSNPLSTAPSRITSDEFTITGVYSNLVRNGAMQLAIPAPTLNQKMTQIITDLLGPRAAAQSYTFTDSSFAIKYLINEDEANNLLHFVLLLVMIVLFPWIKSINAKTDLLFPLVLVFSVLFYAGAIKWQPWGSRLQLPIFLIGAPVFGIVTDKRKISNLLQWLFVLSFMLYSVPYLTLNSSRPLIPLFRKSSPFRVNTIKRFFSDHPNLYDEYSEIISPFYTESSVLRADRVQQYFSNNTSYYEDYINVMNIVNELNPSLVGLDLGSNDWEYPIWVLAGRHASRGVPEFVHIAVEDISKNLGSGSSQIPEYVISTEQFKPSYVEEMGYQVLVDTPTIDLYGR